MRKNRFGLSIALSTPARRLGCGQRHAERDPRPDAALVGLRRNDPVAWSRVRAPLASLGEADARKLGAAIDEIRGKRAA